MGVSEQNLLLFTMTSPECRWAHSVADDFLAKQLPHNVTWGLTMLYSLEHPSDFDDTGTQVWDCAPDREALSPACALSGCSSSSAG